MEKIKIYYYDSYMDKHYKKDFDNLEHFLKTLLNEVEPYATIVYNLNKKVICVDDVIEYDISNLNEEQLFYLQTHKKEFTNKARKIRKRKELEMEA